MRPELKIFIADDGSGCEFEIATETAFEAAQWYVLTSCHKESNGCVNINVSWMDGETKKEETFSVDVPELTGCAAE